MESSRKVTLKSILDSLAAIAIIVACSALTWNLVFERAENAPPAGRQPRVVAPPADPIAFDAVGRRGVPTAAVGVIEFADFECPFCKRFTNGGLADLKREYVDTGKVLFGYYHYPLPIHPEAVPAAVASECAGEQGKFWEFHDDLYNLREKLAGPIYKARADALKLNSTQFTQCLESDKWTAKVKEGEALARRLKISSTPTLFVGALEPDGRLRVKEVIVGAQPYDAVKAAVERVIADSKPGTR